VLGVNKQRVSRGASIKGRSFTGLGALEVEILALVWAREPAAASVRELYEELRRKRSSAYTTVMTVLGDLVKKGLLARDESNTAYLYRAAIPPDEVAGEVLDSVVTVLYRGRTGVAAARLLGLEGEFGEAQLEELRRYARTLLPS
jgi:predicted transcriptional regulator